MTGADHGFTVEMVPLDRITVLNPRVRDKRKFGEIVDSIANVGLKQPIKVSRVQGSNGEPAYNLVYGQGRVEAFLALGQTTIPAIVTELSEEDSLIYSLVENVARRQHRPIELLREIGALKNRGYSDTQIGKKIGYSRHYVRQIRRLLETGEERLLIAVETGQLPLNIAIDIATSDDAGVQEALAEAYEKGLLRGKQLIKVNRLVDQRRRLGKTSSRGASGAPARVSSGALARSLQNQAHRQRLMIKRAEIASSRLRFVVEALQMLLADEHFVTLLRAEGVHTLPAPLARLIEARGGE